MKKKLKCFVCHKEINEEEDYVFKGQTVHKGECLKSMIDEYNAVRNLQIRNKRLCVEIDRLNNIINGIEAYCNMAITMNFNMNNSKLQEQIVEDYTNVLNKLKELKDSD